VSLDLYRERVFWEGGRGSVKGSGRVVTLHAPPVLPGLPDAKVLMIDWAPSLHCEEIMLLHGPRRDMNDAERAAVRRLVAELTA
jgi:hypothetical protein